jgi:hypothetical protein
VVDVAAEGTADELALPTVPANVPIVLPAIVGVDGAPPPPLGTDVSIPAGTLCPTTGVVALPGSSSPMVLSTTTLVAPVPSARIACKFDEEPITDPPSSENREGGGAGGGARRRLGVTSDNPLSRPRLFSLCGVVSPLALSPPDPDPVLRSRSLLPACPLPITDAAFPTGATFFPIPFAPGPGDTLIFKISLSRCLGSAGAGGMFGAGTNPLIL